MAEIIKINSQRALIIIPEEELIMNDLMRWIRTDSRGWGRRDFISVQQIETYASKVYKEKYPSEDVFLMEKAYLDGRDVHAILRTYKSTSQDELYNRYPIGLKPDPSGVIQSLESTKQASKNSTTNPLDSIDNIRWFLENIGLFEKEDLIELDEMLDEVSTQAEQDKPLENESVPSDEVSSTEYKAVTITLGKHEEIGEKDSLSKEVTISIKQDSRD